MKITQLRFKIRIIHFVPSSPSAEFYKKIYAHCPHYIYYVCIEWPNQATLKGKNQVSITKYHVENVRERCICETGHSLKHETISIARSSA